jgi:pSer/pThr/pTyr-binding forkhead associated (FHA) protein
MNREIIIGRSSDLDMVLVEDMVSRRHAKISSTDTEVYIQDIGSTNGTFVNGEKIAGKALLHEGDRILVGTSIIKVVGAGEGSVAQQSEAEARRRLEAGAQQRQATQGRPMSGVIEEIPLPDLLQLLSTSRKSGVLTINNGVSVGKIYMRKGAIYFSTINDDFAVSPQKAIYRMLTWATGTFELEPNVEIQVMEEVQDSTEGLLMEGVRQLDEFRMLQKQLPALASPLAVPTPLAGKLRELTPSELDTFQLVLDHGQLQKVLDNYTGSDLEAAQNIINLMKREFVVVP